MTRLLLFSALAGLALAQPARAQDEDLQAPLADLLEEPSRGAGLGGTELEHVARRLARELSSEARPAPFEARDGSAIYLLGDEGAEGELLLSGLTMGHVFEPAEVPGQGGELLRIPQLAVGVRLLAPGREPRCGVAVLEMQLDPKAGVPHASGLRTLVWADLEQDPQVCGVLEHLVVGEGRHDALLFRAVVLDRREDAKQPPAFAERVPFTLVPGGFLPAAAPRRERLASAPTHLPLVIECQGVDDCAVKAPQEEAEIGSALVRGIAAGLPEVRVLESSHGWGWTRVQLEGPRAQVDAFLVALQEDGSAGSLSAELVVRTGELARATVRFRTGE